MPLQSTRGASSASGFGETLKPGTGPIVEPNVGDAYGGGFYFGRIRVGTDEYRLIVAPKIQGESARGLTGSAGDPMPAGLTLNDGRANTLAFNLDAGTYPATTWARNLNINGFTDWYIPSRDEAEIMYRNMKPTTDQNYVGLRTNALGETGSIQNGVNVNSVPLGTAYTLTDPPQSPVAIFKTGGGQDISLAGAFETLGASNVSTTPPQGCISYLRTGQQAASGNPSLGCMQRAIRREKV